MMLQSERWASLHPSGSASAARAVTWLPADARAATAGNHRRICRDSDDDSAASVILRALDLTVLSAFVGIGPTSNFCERRPATCWPCKAWTAADAVCSAATASGSSPITSLEAGLYARHLCHDAASCTCFCVLVLHQVRAQRSLARLQAGCKRSACLGEMLTVFTAGYMPSYVHAHSHKPTVHAG